MLDLGIEVEAGSEVLVTDGAVEFNFAASTPELHAVLKAITNRYLGSSHFQLIWITLIDANSTVSFFCLLQLYWSSPNAMPAARF